MSAITKIEAIDLAGNFIKQKLCEELWYKNINSHVSAILLYGSVAKGTNKPNSDIDILIILPLKIEEKFTKGEYFYDLEGQHINIVLRSIERLRKLANENNDQFQKEVFRNSEILYERDDEVRKLLKNWSS